MLLNYFKINSFIYDDAVAERFEYEDDIDYILSREFLENLHTKLELDEIKPEIDSQIKNNIYDIVYFIKNNNEDKKNIQLINEIIVSLNSIQGYINDEFYKDQALKRSGRNTLKYKLALNKVSFEQEPAFTEIIRQSMANDYRIIYYLMNLNDKENGELFKLYLLQNCDELFNTLNYLMYDYPKVVFSHSFRKNCGEILSEIKVMCKRSEIDATKPVSEINKLLKKVKS
ncbi:MAG TPA: hypothetical protein PLV83_03415 [Bacilli bacterium]|nr:hypothetical protein [Bacilli bacterium]